MAGMTRTLVPQLTNPYLTDLPGSELTDVQRDLVAAAVRRDEGHVGVVCNDVLVRTNHATELAGSVAPYTLEHRE